MIEEKNEKETNIPLEQKSEIPQINEIKEENINSINSIKKEEKDEDNIKSDTLKKKGITKEFNEEEEKNEINIKYKKDGITMVAISLDLLLKKIVTENFFKENPLKIYSFCQQCFCFIDKEILFNKIFNCYEFYKKKKLVTIRIFDLIKFLNVLVIEMYEYYFPINNLKDPIIVSLNDFYQLLMFEIFEFINEQEKEKEDIKNSQLDFNRKEFKENKIEDTKDNKDELNTDKTSDMVKDRNCIYSLNDDDIIFRDSAHSPNKRSKEMDSDKYLKTEPTHSKMHSFVGKNIPKQALNTKKLKLNNNKKNDSKFFTTNENQPNKNKNIFGKGSIFSKNIFNNLKKEKPIKLKNKDDSHIEKPNKEITKMKKINVIKVSPEEEIVTEITNIKILFSLETKRRELEQTKSKISFYKELKKIVAESIGKPIKDSDLNKVKSRHLMMKSVTTSTLNKIYKLNLPKNEGFFNILDWDKNLIGEKLISISKNNINKIQRRELYRAIFLKKEKNITCPYVMHNIEKFNQLTFFIIQDILSYDFAKDRAKIIEKWITIAEYCKERKDYTDCVAINSALNNYIITGLNKTLKDISRDKKELMKNINKFCKYQGNYKTLREDMAKLDYYDFYIPYLGMLMKDLAFFEENSKYIINDTLINFEKLENVQLAIEKFFNFKNAKDKLNPIIPEELWFFEDLEDLKETELEDLANKLEPEFTLYANKKKEKRKTNIDNLYFSDVKKKTKKSTQK